MALQPSPAELEEAECMLGFADLPEPLMYALFELLTLSELALCCCVSRQFKLWAEERLGKLAALSVEDFARYPALHNYLLLGDGGRPGLRDALRCYLPAAFHYISKRCPGLQQLHLDLPAPPMPVSVAVGRAAAAAAVLAGPPHALPQTQESFPPVDGFLTKLLAQGCPRLRSLRVVNVTNNPAINRLVHVNDAFLAVLAKSCPQLEELHLGHRGGEDCIYNLASSYFCEDISDAGIKAVAKGCTSLTSLGLLRCNKVTDEGLGLVAHYCRRLAALQLHDCPEISDTALVEVAESCPLLRRLDITVARRVAGLLMGEEAEQLGFRALFTLAANCPLLEELAISEAALDSGAVDDDCLTCIAHGCRRLRRLELRHCSSVTDAGLSAIAKLCKELQELTLEHSGVGDAGVLAIAKGCPQLARLHITNYSTRLSMLPLSSLEGGDGSVRGVSDAALKHIADHCGALTDLAITGSRLVTDSGIEYLALPKHAALHARLRHLAVNHTGATEGSVCALLGRCAELRSLGIRGLLFNADSTAECIAQNCRHLKAADLRHCSTLSDAGLAALAAGCPFLEDLAASFCGRLTDEGVAALAERAGGRLRRLELYHVPQLSARGVAALVARCGAGLRAVNLGKCGAVGELAGQGGFLVQACHYLDQ